VKHESVANIEPTVSIQGGDSIDTGRNVPWNVPGWNIAKPAFHTIHILLDERINRHRNMRNSPFSRQKGDINTKISASGALSKEDAVITGKVPETLVHHIV
jgi:hypothetical protein